MPEKPQINFGPDPDGGGLVFRRGDEHICTVPPDAMFQFIDRLENNADDPVGKRVAARFREYMGQGTRG